MRALFMLVGACVVAACVVPTEPVPTSETAEPPLEVWPHEDLDRLPMRKWRVGRLNDDGNDVIRSALEAGTLGYPDEGTDANGTRWVDATADEKTGALGPYSPNAFVWAVSLPEREAGDRLIGRASRALDLMIGTAAQPGYYYGDRNRLVPLPVRNDGDRVAVRAFGNSEFQVEVWRTSAELWLNTDDVTPVDFVVGESQTQMIALPVLNLIPETLPQVMASVVESEDSSFLATSSVIESLPAAGVTHVPFELVLREAPTEVDQELTATLRIEAPGLSYAYERSVTFVARAEEDGANRWRTFVSPVDGSVQSFGVRQPSNFDPKQAYSLILSLHGAGVGAAGQSAAYGAKDWAYVVAPTNRHPFGFDWEEWGRANALATLDHAMDRFVIDPTRVYLTGHSMGGHGTWHVGVTTPGRFATVAPSAGWESFYSYGGTSRPTGAFARARAHSDTLVYLENLAQRGIYVIHGDADNNVPVSEGRKMVAAAEKINDDVQYHEEPGAGHWWDGDPAPGAACVDFPPMMEWIQSFTLDPTELDFSFRSPSPGYSPDHSVVRLQSVRDGNEDVVIDAWTEGTTWNLATDNARSLTLDGTALLDKGITTVLIDETEVPLTEGDIEWGPTDGKRASVHGPFGQVMRRPFCFVHPGGDGPASQYASWLISFWSNLASGSACSITPDQLTDEIRTTRNLIWVGLPEDVVNPTVDVGWGDEIRVGGDVYPSGILYVVFPAEGRLHAAIVATPGHEYDGFGINPISSRGGLPDLFVYERGVGTRVAAMFDGDWTLR